MKRVSCISFWAIFAGALFLCPFASAGCTNGVDCHISENPDLSLDGFRCAAAWDKFARLGSPFCLGPYSKAAFHSADCPQKGLSSCRETRVFNQAAVPHDLFGENSPTGTVWVAQSSGPAYVPRNILPARAPPPSGIYPPLFVRNTPCGALAFFPFSTQPSTLLVLKCPEIENSFGIESLPANAAVRPCRFSVATMLAAGRVCHPRLINRKIGGILYET